MAIYKMWPTIPTEEVFINESTARHAYEIVDSYLTFLHIGHIFGTITTTGSGATDPVKIWAGFRWHQNGRLWTLDTDTNVAHVNIGSGSVYTVYALENGQGFTATRQTPSYRSTQAALYFENMRALAVHTGSAVSLYTQDTMQSIQ